MNIRQLLNIAKITPNRALDQHFLYDDKILDKEVSLAGLKKSDVVLEVGAGIGNLTLRLSKKVRVIAIEKDYSFTHILKSMPNTDTVMGDAIEFLESLRKQGVGDGKAKGLSRDGVKYAHGPFNKIVSNIPYSISQQLLLEFFRHRWEIAVLLVQKEFAEKLVSKERLGLIISDIADIKIAMQVPAEAFYPKAVPSSLVVIKQKKLLDDGFWKFACKLKPNRNVSNQVKKPGKLGSKKIHQLTLTQLKKLYAENT